MATKKQSRVNTRKAPTTGYFAQGAAPAEAPAAPARGGAVERPQDGPTGAPVTTPNLAPGLQTLGADADAPGAGITDTGPYTAGTPDDARQAASVLGGASAIATPASIAARDAGLFGAASAAGKMAGGLGVAADLSEGRYGSAAAKGGAMFGGPVGLALGLGLGAYDAIQGAFGEEGVPNSLMGDLGARARTAADEGSFREQTTPEDTGVYFDGSRYSEAPTTGFAPTENPMDAYGLAASDFGAYGLGAESNTDSVGRSDASAPGSTEGGFGGSSAENSADSSGGYGGVFADGGMINQPVGLSIPGYADGGEMGGGPLLAMGFAGGGPIGMGNPGGDMSPQMIEMKVNQMVRNPQFQQGVMQAVQPLMQSGELTPQEITTMGQIAMASMQNPKLYPQLRQFVAQQGMAPLPPAYDPTTIMKILAVTRALEQSGGGMAAPGQGQPTPAGQVPPVSRAQMVNPTGQPSGGMLQGPGTGRSDSIGTVNMATGGPVKVSNGEYVIPEHVVRAKGRDFFDALLRRYSEVPKAEA